MKHAALLLCTAALAAAPAATSAQVFYIGGPHVSGDGTMGDSIYMLDIGTGAISAVGTGYPSVHALDYHAGTLWVSGLGMGGYFGPMNFGTGYAVESASAETTAGNIALNGDRAAVTSNWGLGAGIVLLETDSFDQENAIYIPLTGALAGDSYLESFRLDYRGDGALIAVGHLDDGENGVYAIDVATGASSLIASLDVDGDISGLTIHGSEGYFIVGDTLYAFDAFTGAYSDIFTLTGPLANGVSGLTIIPAPGAASLLAAAGLAAARRRR